MCRLYEVTRDGYNSWRRRGVSARKLEDEALYDIIAHHFKKSGGVYGSPKITQLIRSQGYPVARKRVARIMQENGLIARRARIYRKMPGLCHFIRSVPNRELAALANEPNKVWVGDITYVRVDGEWHYLAVVLDKHSRRVISWGLSDRRTADLTWRVMRQALRIRKPPAGLIFHTDRGIEYRAFHFAERVAKRGIIQSMNRPRRMNDNAHMESFFANFKAERIHGREDFQTQDELWGVMSEYVNFYNCQRIHSSIGYTTPEQYECKLA